MIVAITGSGSYSSVQRVSSVRVRSNTAASAENHAIIAQEAASPKLPVQRVGAAAPVTSGGSGNLNTDLSVRNSVDVTAMAVRSRISPAENQQPVALPNVQAEALKAEDAQAGESPQALGQDLVNDWQAEQAHRQAKAEERAQAEQEAQEQREAYLESLEETQQKRDQRIEALRAEQSQEKDGEKEAVNQTGTGEEDAQQAEEPGSLEFDYAAALMQNYQMTNLLWGQISARMNGGDPEPFQAAIDALFQNGQDRLHFVPEDNEESSRQAQQLMYSSMLANAVA